MNLFENLQMMNETLGYETQIDYDILRQSNVEFFENGVGVYRLITPDGDKLDVDIETQNDNGVLKWFVSLPSEDIRTVDTDLTSAILTLVDKLSRPSIKSLTRGRNMKDMTESKNSLWDKFNRHYEGFIPLKDLTNYFSLNQFGEFVQWCRHEADLDYDYEKKYSNWDEIYNEIFEIWDSVDVESISMENVFNFFTTSDLEEFWDWIEIEYDLNDDLEESKKIVNEKIKEQDFKNTTNAIKLFTDVFGDKVTFKDICECLDDEILFTLYKYLIDKYGFYGDGKNGEEADNELIDSTTYEESNEVEEATCGIGGAYSTKAIDILPTGVKKIKESLYDEYLERVMDETSNVELVNLLHEIRDNKELKKDDKKKLEDEIRTKVRSIKTEAITEFYGKEWSDEEIQDMINKTKENPGIEMVADPNEIAYPLNYNGKNYWLIGEEKEIVFDGKNCVVVLTVDDNLKRYLTYFEYTLYDDGDGESGPQELKMDVSNVPYKIVEV